MSALTDILDTFRAASQTEREKGTYFENLVKVYLQTEPKYKDLFNGLKEMNNFLIKVKQVELGTVWKNMNIQKSTNYKYYWLILYYERICF